VQASGAVGIGARTLVGERSVVIADAGVSVGDSCVIGDEVLLSDNVRVGSRVRIGPRACLMTGAEVPDGTVILARSVVEGPGRAQTVARSRSR
jgi:carbonic anhydrase/acetyltransferase-like protein (isoleucine patch superfamily)